jgi:Tfp pilus assembly protein PilV
MKNLSPAGLTLVEFLFAISVIAVAALGVASMFPAAYKTVLEGGQVTKATMLAREMMSMIHSYPYDMVTQSSYLWPNFDTRTHWTVANTQCPPDPSAFSLSERNTSYFNVKWRCDLVGTPGSTTGQGLSGAYGTVALACVDGNWNESSPWCVSDVVRVTVEVHWGASGSQMVRLVGYVSRPRM